jgi:hypothetical protein
MRTGPCITVTVSSANTAYLSLQSGHRQGTPLQEIGCVFDSLLKIFDQFTSPAGSKADRT